MYEGINYASTQHWSATEIWGMPPPQENRQILVLFGWFWYNLGGNFQPACPHYCDINMAEVMRERFKEGCPPL